MTELLIDGVRVVLPPDFSIPYTTENPFLTKSGEYTLDIELSLLDSTNARLYRHLGRFNASQVFTGRKLVLISNNFVLINGTEIILEVTDSVVKIQAVSGNAELNFLGSEKKITDLDLGFVSEYTYASARFPIDSPEVAEQYPCTDPAVENGCYPQFNYNTATVKTTEDTFINHPYVYYDAATNSGYYTPPVTKGTPQPYLLYYVSKIPEAIGFPIIENSLLDVGLFCKLYIVNTIKSNKYCQFLPEWTVNEFISEIEKLFNVVFVVDRLAKNIRILNSFTQFAENREYIDSPIDEFVNSIDKSNQVDSLDYDYVEYDLPGDDKYMRIESEVFDVVSNNKFSTYDAMKSDIASNILKYKDKKEILYVTQSDNYYIVVSNATGYDIKPVNVFRSVGDKTGNNISLKIVPAAICAVDARLVDDPGRGMVNPSYITVGTFQAPLSPTFSSGETQTLTEIIEDGLTSGSKPDRIRISIYMGMHSAKKDTGETSQYPLALYRWSQNDTYLSFVWKQKVEKIFLPKDIEDALYTMNNSIPYSPEWLMAKSIYQPAVGIYDKFTLRLSSYTGMYSRYYSKSVNFDSSQKHEISFPAKAFPDPRAEFVIRNKSFICEKIEYQVNAEGFEDVAKGYFYPKK